MKKYEDIVKNILEKVNHYNSLAIGYPTNRGHAFNINKNLLQEFSNTYYNSLLGHNDEIIKIEPIVIKMLANHFNVDDSNFFGYISSGGTEASFSCLWWHRKFLSYTCNKMPVLISSKSSHYSIDKIAEQLAMEGIKINPDSNDQMDLKELEEVLKSTDAPVIVSSNLGYTVKGGIDNIQEIYNLLNKYKKNQYKLHIDGAVYGIIAPYLLQFKNINSIFDIADSLTFSGHKFLGTYNITGVALTKTNYIEDSFYHINTMKDVQYLKRDEYRDFTFSGSRQSEFAVEIYMLLNEAFKLEGENTALENLWNSCLETTEWFITELKSILTLEQQKDLIHIKGQLAMLLPLPSSKEAQDYMYKKYELMFVSESQCGVYIFPSRTREILNIFLEDYRKIWDV